MKAGDDPHVSVDEQLVFYEVRPNKPRAIPCCIAGDRKKHLLTGSPVRGSVTTCQNVEAILKGKRRLGLHFFLYLELQIK